MFFFLAPLLDRAEFHDQLKVAQKVVIVEHLRSSPASCIAAPGVALSS
jgi:hypothetical protein